MNFLQKINKTQWEEILIATFIIATLLLQLGQQGLLISYESNINFLIVETSTIVLTLIVVGLFEKTYIEERRKLIYSSILLFISSLAIIYFMNIFVVIQSSLFIAVVGSVFLKILNSYRNFDRFKQSIFKHSVALIYSTLFLTLIAVCIEIYYKNYIQLIPLVWVLMYFVYIGYLLPFKYNTTDSLI